jgi:transmembrane 9 superfamily protein 2/4
MRESKKCKVVGRIDKLSEKSAKVFKSRIKDEYHVNMILDNLPVAVSKTIRNENGDTFSMFDRGFLIGGKDNEGKFFINNHLSFVIKYHEDAQLSTSRIVGFEVTPHRCVSLVHTIHYRMC